MGFLDVYRRRNFSRRTFLARGLALASAASLTSVPDLSAAWAADEMPKRGGMLRAAQEVDPITLDPHKGVFASLQAYDPIYESLTAYDEKMNVIPSLAQKWEISNDGKRYVFHLRPNVQFHNGQPMTAEDVRYSMQRVLDAKTASPFRSWFSSITDIKTINPLTVEMTLDSPYPDLLGAFAALAASAIIPNGLAERENLAIKAVGTGPFKLVEYVPQDYIAYVRNAQYWDQPLPYLDGMTFKIMTEELQRITALRAGQLDYAAVTAQGTEQLGGMSGIRILKAPYAWLGLHHINVSRKPLDDGRVRRALRMAVDTHEVIRKAVYDGGVPSGPINTGFADWFIDPRKLPYLSADVTGARKLLAEAGYPNGGFTIQIKCSPQYPESVSTSLVIQDALRKLNVNVNVLQMEWGALIANAREAAQTGGKDGDDVFAFPMTFRPSPDGYIYPWFYPGGGFNFGGYNNSALNPLILQARSMSDHEPRRRRYVEIQEMLLADSPKWWWYAKYNIEALSTKFRGYSQSFTGLRTFLKKTWIGG